MVKNRTDRKSLKVLPPTADSWPPHFYGIKNVVYSVEMLLAKLLGTADTAGGGGGR